MSQTGQQTITLHILPNTLGQSGSETWSVNRV